MRVNEDLRGQLGNTSPSDCDGKDLKETDTGLYSRWPNRERPAARAVGGVAGMHCVPAAASCLPETFSAQGTDVRMAMTRVVTRVEQPTEEKPVPAGEKEPLELSPVFTGNDKAARALGQGTGGHTRRAQQVEGASPSAESSLWVIS